MGRAMVAQAACNSDIIIIFAACDSHHPENQVIKCMYFLFSAAKEEQKNSTLMHTFIESYVVEWLLINSVPLWGHNEINMKLASLLSLKHEDMKQQQLAKALFIWSFPPIRT